MKADSSQDLNCSDPAQNSSKQIGEQSTFIMKAYQLINNPNHSQIIHWSKSGQTFIIQDIERFQKQLLPLYFRHNRYQSFVRQLNMYDFHKIRNGDYYTQNKSQFRHQLFVQGNLEAIACIRRKGFRGDKGDKGEGKASKNKKIQKSATKKSAKKRKASPQNSGQKQVQKPSMDDQQENSFFADLPVSLSNIQAQSKQNRLESVQKVIDQVLKSYEGKSFKEQQKKNKINAIIQLAQTVKDKWIQEFKKISGGDDILVMKDTYSKVKDKLFQLDNIRKQSSTLSTLEPSAQTKKNMDEKPIQFDYIQMMEEEDAIIESIFKAEIRSTLICITSETYLNGVLPKKNDTLMGM